MIRKKPAAAVAISLAAALSLAACSSSGGKEDTATTAAGGNAGTPTMKVAFITHQAPGDTFWDIIRKGAEAAAAKDNIDLDYSNDPDATKQAQLIQARHRQEGRRHRGHRPEHPALGAAIKAAVAAGIPVTMLNAGLQRRPRPGCDRLLRPGREGRRHRRRQEDRRRGRQEHHLRHPGAGPAAARGPLRRCRRGCRGRQGRARLRQRPRRLRRDHDDPGQADRGPGHRHVLTLGAQFALDAVKTRRGGRQQGQDRHVRHQQGARRRHQGRATWASPSTSSPTSRATWPSTRSGCSRPTATPSVVAATR